MAVVHWMTTNPITAAPTDKLITVQQRMRQHMSRSMPVIRDGKLAGIITEHDLEAKSQNLEDTLVEACMTREVLTMRPNQSVWDAARLLAERKIHGMPVLGEQGTLVGSITATDLLRAFTAIQDS
jgi:acetoin utilization protein AcuB